MLVYQIIRFSNDGAVGLSYLSYFCFIDSWVAELGASVLDRNQISGINISRVDKFDYQRV